LCLAAFWPAAVGPSLAVGPQQWRHTAEAHFADGTFDAVAVTSLGEVTLAPKIEVRMPTTAAPAVVSAVAVDGPVLYAADGTAPVIYKIADGKAERFAEWFALRYGYAV